MERRSFRSRFVVPAGAVVLIMIASGLIYDASWRIEGEGLRSAIAFVSGIILWASIGHGTLLAYPMAFFRGASMGERMGACVLTPLTWNVKEMVRVSEFFTPGESLYYGLNSLFLLAVIGAFAQMGLCELICRWRLRREGREDIRIFSALPVVAILAGVLAFLVMSAWGQGVHWFYVYMQGYKALFL